jgi:predicted nucleotidyltransferase
MLYNYHINQTTLRILGLFRSNYEASFYLREIARATQVDAKAVTIQLHRLEKANILKSTLKGKNKEYCLDLGNYLSLYHLVLAETYLTLDYLSRNFEVKKLVSETTDSLGDCAVLFGSFAKEETTRESDIDILVIADKRPDLGAFKEVGSLLGREVNVKSMSERQFINGLLSSDPLVWEVADNHVILKGIDNICGMMWRYHARRPETPVLVPKTEQRHKAH